MIELFKFWLEEHPYHFSSARAIVIQLTRVADAANRACLPQKGEADILRYWRDLRKELVALDTVIAEWDKR